MRRKYVAGNWKMNLSLADATALLDGIAAKKPADAAIDIGVFPSFARTGGSGPCSEWRW